jgi:N-acetylmuramoyl-L-alanine amidase
MQLLALHRRWLPALLAVLLLVGVLSLYEPRSTSDSAVSAAPTPAAPAHDVPVVEASTRRTATPRPPTEVPVATALPSAPIPTISADDHGVLLDGDGGLPDLAASEAPGAPAPAPARLSGPPRVGLQVGHWKSSELPDELARLRTSTGARAGNLTEAQVNLAVAQRAAKLLESVGVTVDVLPATVPPGYDADVFVAIHSDGTSNKNARGFKLSTPWRASRASLLLLNTLTEEYGRATGLPPGGAPTLNMRGYYAFTARNHKYAIAKTTPAVILELAFMTNPTDLWYLTSQQDNLAVGVANGIIRYLNERDPSDRAALVPPDFPPQRALDPAGVDVRAAPRDDAKVLLHADAERVIVPLQEQGDWYQVVVRGEWAKIGWVRKSQLQISRAPTPTPAPPADS